MPSETAESEPTQGDRHLHCIAEKGKIGWKKLPGHNKRSPAEIARWDADTDFTNAPQHRAFGSDHVTLGPYETVEIHTAT